MQLHFRTYLHRSIQQWGDVVSARLRPLKVVSGWGRVLLTPRPADTPRPLAASHFSGARYTGRRGWRSAWSSSRHESAGVQGNPQAPESGEARLSFVIKRHITTEWDKRLGTSQHLRPTNRYFSEGGLPPYTLLCLCLQGPRGCANLMVHNKGVSRQISYLNIQIQILDLKLLEKVNEVKSF